MKSKLSKSLVVLGSSLWLFACQAAEKFPFAYYGLDAKSYSGRLLGPSPKQDLPLERCKPDEEVRGKCIVMLVDEFELFRLDWDRLKQELIECQKR